MLKNPMPAAFIYDAKHWIAKAVYRNACLITIHHATSFFDANRQATLDLEERRLRQKNLE